MKLIYNLNGYKVFKTKILGYHCKVHETTQSDCLVFVPMGKNEADKKMFDELVYFRKSNYKDYPKYWGKTKTEAVKNVRNFIKNYRKDQLIFGMKKIVDKSFLKKEEK